MRKQWNIAMLQMDVKIGEPEKNFKRLVEMLEEAVNVPESQKPDVILAPEMWNTGYALEQIHELADTEGERTQQLISSFCRKHRIHVISGSIAYKTADHKVTNTILSFNRDGELTGQYSKLHLFRLMDEEKYLTAGSQLGQLQLDDVQAGMMICYDIRFPELSRKLALDGAKILFVPAEWPHPRLAHWRTLLQARAIENQMFIVACNRTGTSGSTSFFGHSMIVDPWGEILCEGQEEEGVLRASVDLALVDQVRNKIPVFEDRRPQFYQ